MGCPNGKRLASRLKQALKLLMVDLDHLAREEWDELRIGIRRCGVGGADRGYSLHSR